MNGMHPYERDLTNHYTRFLTHFEKVICYPNEPGNYTDSVILLSENNLSFSDTEPLQPYTFPSPSFPLIYRKQNLPKLILLFQDPYHVQNLHRLLLDLLPLIEEVYKGFELLKQERFFTLRTFTQNNPHLRPYLALHYLILIQHIVSYISQPEGIKWAGNSQHNDENNGENAFKMKPIGHTTHLIGQCGTYARATMHLLGLQPGEKTPWRLLDSLPDMLDHITGEIMYDIIFEAKKLKFQQFLESEQRQQGDGNVSTLTEASVSILTYPQTPLFPNEYNVEHNWDIFDHPSPDHPSPDHIQSSSSIHNGTTNPKKTLQLTTLLFPHLNEREGHPDDRLSLEEQFLLVPISINRQLAVIIDANIDFLWYFAEGCSSNVAHSELNIAGQALIPQLSLPYTRLQTCEFIIAHLNGLDRQSGDNGDEDDDEGEGEVDCNVNMRVIDALISKYFSTITFPITPSIEYSVLQQNYVTLTTLPSSTSMLIGKTMEKMFSGQPTFAFSQQPNFAIFLFPLYSHLSDSYMVWLYHRKRIDKRFKIISVPTVGNINQDAIDEMEKWFYDNYYKNNHKSIENIDQMTAQRVDMIDMIEMIENNANKVKEIQNESQVANNYNQQHTHQTNVTTLSVHKPNQLTHSDQNTQYLGHNPRTIPLDQPLFKSISTPSSFSGPFADTDCPFLDAFQNVLDFPILPHLRLWTGDINWSDYRIGKAMKQSLLLALANQELSADQLQGEEYKSKLFDQSMKFVPTKPFRHPTMMGNPMDADLNINLNNQNNKDDDDDAQLNNENDKDEFDNDKTPHTDIGYGDLIQVFNALELIGGWTYQIYTESYFTIAAMLKEGCKPIQWDIDVHSSRPASVPLLTSLSTPLSPIPSSPLYPSLHQQPQEQNSKNPNIFISDLIFEYIFHTRNLNIGLIPSDDDLFELQNEQKFPLETYHQSLKAKEKCYKSSILPHIANTHYSPHPRLNKCNAACAFENGISTYFSLWQQQILLHWESFFVGNTATNLNFWLRAVFGTKRIRYRQIYKNDCKPSKLQFSNVENYDLYIHPEMTTLYKDSSLCILQLDDEYQNLRRDDTKEHLANPRLFRTYDSDLFITHIIFQQLLTLITGIDRPYTRKRFYPSEIDNLEPLSCSAENASIGGDSHRIDFSDDNNTDGKNGDNNGSEDLVARSAQSVVSSSSPFSSLLQSKPDPILLKPSVSTDNTNTMIEQIPHGYMFLIHFLLHKNFGENLFFLSSSAPSGSGYEVEPRYSSPIVDVDSQLYLNVLNALHKFIFQPTVVTFDHSTIDNHHNFHLPDSCSGLPPIFPKPKSQTSSKALSPSAEQLSFTPIPVDPLFNTHSPLDPSKFYLKKHPPLLHRPLYALYCDTLIWILHGFAFFSFETSRKNNSTTLHRFDDTIMHHNYHINGLPDSTLLSACESIKKQREKNRQKVQKYQENAKRLRFLGKRPPPPPAPFSLVDDYDYNQNRTKLTPDLLRVTGDRYVREWMKRTANLGIGLGPTSPSALSGHQLLQQQPNVEMDTKKDIIDNDDTNDDDENNNDEKKICPESKSTLTPPISTKIPISTEHSSAMVQFCIESFIDLLLHPIPWGIIQTFDFSQRKSFPDLVPMAEIDTIVPTLEDLFAPISSSAAALTTTPASASAPGTRPAMSMDCKHDVNSMGLFLDPQYSSSVLQYRQLAERFVPNPSQSNNMEDNAIPITGSGSNRSAPILYPKTPQHFGFFNNLPQEELNAVYKAFDLHNITPVYGRPVTINKGKWPIGLPLDPLAKDVDYLPIYYNHLMTNENISRHQLPPTSERPRQLKRTTHPTFGVMDLKQDNDKDEEIEGEKEKEGEEEEGEEEEGSQQQLQQQFLPLSTAANQYPTLSITMSHQTPLTDFSQDYSDYFNINPNEIADGLNFIASTCLREVESQITSTPSTSMLKPRIHCSNPKVRQEIEQYYGLTKPNYDPDDDFFSPSCFPSKRALTARSSGRNDQNSQNSQNDQNDQNDQNSPKQPKTTKTTKTAKAIQIQINQVFFH